MPGEDVNLDTFAKIRGQTRSATLYGDDYASLEQVQALAHGYNVGILVIHHTGKESREDPLDEVNATQGLNGVADNILILRRERGKREATLIGDGRELVEVEQRLAFDLAAGGWRLSEAPPADQPKTPERAEILDLLKTSPEPLSPKQVAEELGKNGNTINNLLRRMVREGDIKLVGYGKYTTVASVASVETSGASSSKKDEEKNKHTLFEKNEGPSVSKLATVATLATDVQENEPEQVEKVNETPPTAGPPSLETLRFASMVAEVTHSRLEAGSAILTPDAADPFTLQPSGLRPVSLAQAAQGQLWPISGDCTGVFCQGACVCGEHVCDPCGCEAGALVDHHPWYYERRAVRRGAICEYCYAPATVASRWQTPMCERCWQIASRGQGIDPRSYLPRPFGPIPGDEEAEDETDEG